MVVRSNNKRNASDLLKFRTDKPVGYLFEKHSSRLAQTHFSREQMFSICSFPHYIQDLVVDCGQSAVF